MRLGNNSPSFVEAVASAAINFTQKPKIPVVPHLYKELVAEKKCMPLEESLPKKSRPLQQHLFFLLQDHCQSSKQLAQIHAQIAINGLSHKNFIRVKLLSLYTAFDQFSVAHQLFEETPNPSSALCNQIIRGFLINGNSRRSVELFSCMGRHYFPPPDEHTYNFVVNGCAKGGLFGEGLQIHGQVLKSGFCSNVFVQSSLVDFYVKNGGKDGVANAKKVFDEMSERSIVTWNSLLLGSIRCGDIDGARRFFEEIPGKNVVSWTTMIAGLAQNGRPKEALGLFREMLSENVEFDQVTLVSVLSACAELGDLKLGKWIHSYVFEHFSYQKKPVLATLNNSLVHMYASCGEIDAAFGVFKEIEKKTTVSWTTMITGFAKHGYGNEALAVFQWMQSTGSKDVKPDEITFLGVLCACSHSGYVNEGHNYFKSMVENWGIKPTIEHFGCMVDLLSRAGLLDEAHDLVRTMPMKPNDIVWGALLGGCRIHKSVELAADVTELMIADIDPSRASAYFVLLSNVYAAAKKWEEVVAVRKKMLETKTKKIPGRSWIQIEGSVYEFMAGDRSHEKAGLIYDVLDDILGEARFHGCIPYFADS